MPPRLGISYKHTNTLLLVLIVGINSYIIAAPLVPRATYWWQSHHTARRAELTKIVHRPAGKTTKPVKTDRPNGLIIPAMLLDQPTVEGPERNWSDLLKQGIWRWPASSTPDRGGNTVFLAHRFSYTGPHGAFYYLNKLKKGDEIGVTWRGKLYTYTVVSSREVPPTETSIQDNTTKPQITLFTCTPLWHPVNRLVVIATLRGNL